MIPNLKEEWKKSSALRYEEHFHETIVNAFCQWQSSTDSGRNERGRVFNAGYEVFLYAFFIGLFRNERRPLVGKGKSFSMYISDLGNVSQRGTNRKKYTELVLRYVYAALLTKTDLDLVEYDLGHIKSDDAVNMLMTTLNEYANAGFYAIHEKMEENPDYFLNDMNILEFVGVNR